MKAFVLTGLITTLVLMSDSYVRADESANEVVRIDYLYIDVDTYFPVTMDNIGQHANCHFVFPEGSESISAIRFLVEPSMSGELADGLVRLKLSMSAGHEAFVDQLGGVLFTNSGTQGRIAPDQFLALKVLMNTLARVEHCGPGNTVPTE
jgi:hypothetical protein